MLKTGSPEAIVEKAIGCVVTKADHFALGDKKSIGWQRYVDAEVAVYDMQFSPPRYKVTPEGIIL